MAAPWSTWHRLTGKNMVWLMILLGETRFVLICAMLALCAPWCIGVQWLGTSSDLMMSMPKFEELKLFCVI
jgi:hypothetical protein